MKYKKVLPGILMLLTILSSVACVRVDTGSTLPTSGEQILDLVGVHEIGLISDTKTCVAQGPGTIAFY